MKRRIVDVVQFNATKNKNEHSHKRKLILHHSCRTQRKMPTTKLTVKHRNSLPRPRVYSYKVLFCLSAAILYFRELPHPKKDPQ